MEKIYILIEVFPYEGIENLEVFSSEEKAQARMAEYEFEFPSREYQIEIHTVK